jgi:hypothetical protein
MSAQTTYLKDVAVQEMEALSEELASRSTSATAVSEAPPTADQLQSITEEVFLDAGGNKVRGPGGRFMTWEEARQFASGTKPSTKKRLCKHSNNLWYLSAILTLLSEIREEEGSGSEKH